MPEQHAFAFWRGCNPKVCVVMTRNDLMPAAEGGEGGPVGRWTWCACNGEWQPGGFQMQRRRLVAGRDQEAALSEMAVRCRQAGPADAQRLYRFSTNGSFTR